MSWSLIEGKCCSVCRVWDVRIINLVFFMLRVVERSTCSHACEYFMCVSGEREREKERQQQGHEE